MDAHREELVARLTTELHLSVPERALFALNPLQREEVAASISRIIELRGFFPPHARPWSSGQTVFEGQFIELSAHRAILHWQRPYATQPKQLAEKGQRTFRNLAEAIDVFIRQEWPDGIDGLQFS